MGSGTPDGRRLELFVRSLAPARGPAADQARRVRALATADRVAAADVYVWGEEVGLSTTAFRTPVGKCVLDRVAAFRGWAAERDATMEPFFEARDVRGTVTGESYATLRLPASCLAEYVAGDLVHVAPIRDGSRTVTVGDRLAALEAPTEDGAVGHPATH